MVLKHLTHVDDVCITEEPKIFYKSINALRQLNHFLYTKKKAQNIHIDYKYDGSMSLLFGKNPHDNNTFFVSTKSFFNKDRKWYPAHYNHFKPELTDKLRSLYNDIKCQINEKTYFQGDLLWMDSNLIEDRGNSYCQPNLLKYRMPLQTTKVGIAVHTRYDYVDDSESKFTPYVQDHLRDTPDVKYNFGGFRNYGNYQQIDYDMVNKNLDFAMNLYNEYTKDRNMNEYMKGFVSEMCKLAEDDDYFDDALYEGTRVPNRVWRSIRSVKKILMDHMDENCHHAFITPYLNGKETVHEGYVLTFDDQRFKLVKRTVFSKENRLKWQSKKS